MDWSPVLAELPKAVPYTIGALVGGLVGGLMGIVGGVTAQYYTHRLTRRREAETLRLTKAEELLCELYAHVEWTETKYQALLFQQVHDVPSPFNRARAIQRLYFPELAQAFLVFDEGSDPYVAALLVRHHEVPYTRTQLRELDAGRAEPGLHEDLAPLHQAYLDAWQTVVGEVMAALSALAPATGSKRTPRP
jgi:hypothetical protein